MYKRAGNTKTTGKNNKTPWGLITLLLLLTAGLFFVFRQRIGPLFHPQKQSSQSEIKSEEKKSVAIYCPIKESSFATDQAVKTKETISTTSEAVTTVTIQEQNLTGREEKVDKCFHLDEMGVIFKEAPLISGGPFLVIYDRSKQDRKIGDQVFKPAVINFITQVKQKINLEVASLTIISPIADDLEILTAKEGWKIYLDATRDADKQLDILKKLLAQGITPKEYVDLRIENRVFYK